jgi:hypothetical protein
MTDPRTLEHLLPLACQWARDQQDIILARGAALTPQHVSDARQAGVQDCSRIRVLVVERLPVSDNQLLADVARGRNIVTAATRGAGIGYG